MKQLQYILSLAVIILITSCTTNHPLKREQKPADTIYTDKAAMKIFDYNPERALLIIDSAEIVGNLTHDRASFLRAKIFTTTLEGMHLDSAQKICLSLMHSDYVKNDDNLESVLDLLVSITRRKQDYDQWLKWSTEKADFCRKQGNTVETLRTEAEIGVILAFLGRTDEGLQTLDNVLEQLDGVRRFNETDACIIALRRKVDVLQQSERYSDIIPIAQKIIEITNDYEHHPDEFRDGSFREPKIENVPDYCDFYRVKAYAYLARAYAETGNITEARHYLNLFEQSRYGQTFDGRMMISMTWCKLGEFDKMLAIYDEVENYMEGDTINETYSIMLQNRAIAAEASGDTRKASNYWRRYAELNMALSSQQQHSKAQEYAAKYFAKEQQLEIDQHKLQNRLMNYVLLAMLIALLATVFSYNHTVVQKKRLAEKNAALVRMIDEKTRQISQKDDSRLAEACTLLVEQPEMKIADVAKKIGLTPQNMAKLFHDHYGMSPSEYRASHTV